MHTHPLINILLSYCFLLWAPKAFSGFGVSNTRIQLLPLLICSHLSSPLTITNGPLWHYWLLNWSIPQSTLLLTLTFFTSSMPGASLWENLFLFWHCFGQHWYSFYWMFTASFGAIDIIHSDPGRGRRVQHQGWKTWWFQYSRQYHFKPKG